MIFLFWLQILVISESYASTLSFAYQNACTNALDVLIHISFQESCNLSQETAGSVDLAYLMIQQNDAKTFD